MERLSNDFQSQWALGHDASDGPFCVFRRPLARDGGRGQRRRDGKIGKRGGAGDNAQIRQARYTPLEKYAHRKSGKVAQRSDSDSAADAANGDDRSAITPSVANANAQLAAADKPAGNVAKAMSARASDIIQAPPAQPAAADQFVAADQLNDVDRALRETPPASAPAAATLTMAAAETPGAPATAAASAGSDNSTWDQTTLIGKIFIGFGTLLTMASAARMFMA
jgi:hypothetical protein